MHKKGSAPGADTGAAWTLMFSATSPSPNAKALTHHPKLLIPYLVVRSLATRGLSTAIDRNTSSLSMEGGASPFLTTPWAGGVGGAAYSADTAFTSSAPSNPLWAWLPHCNPHPTLLPSPDPEDALGPQGLCPWAYGQSLMLGFCSPARGGFLEYGIWM